MGHLGPKSGSICNICMLNDHIKFQKRFKKFLVGVALAVLDGNPSVPLAEPVSSSTPDPNRAVVPHRKALLIAEAHLWEHAEA